MERANSDGWVVSGQLRSGIVDTCSVLLVHLRVWGCFDVAWGAPKRPTGHRRPQRGGVRMDGANSGYVEYPPSSGFKEERKSEPCLRAKHSSKLGERWSDKRPRARTVTSDDVTRKRDAPRKPNHQASRAAWGGGSEKTALCSMAPRRGMAALWQRYVSSMAALGQFYVSSMPVLCQFYGSVRSVLCQFYVSSMSVLCPWLCPSISSISS